MLTFLPAPILGAIMAVLLLINTVFWVIPVYTVVLIKLVTPTTFLYLAADRPNTNLAIVRNAVNKHAPALAA